MQVVITPHALMAPIHEKNLDIDDFIFHYRLLKFISRNRDFCTSYVFPDTIEVLGDNNLFPVFKTFRDYLASNDLEDEISPQDLVTLFNNVMDWSLDVKEDSNVHDFDISEEFDFPTITTTPICNKYTNNSIAYCGYLNNMKGQTFSPLLDSNITSNQYNYIIPNASVLDGDDVIDLFNFIPNVDLFTSCTDLMDRYSPALLWQKATTEFSYKLAIFYKCKEIASTLENIDEASYSIDSFEIGSNFINSLTSHQCSGSGRFSMTLLDSIAKLILNVPKNEVKDFTVSAASSTVRNRGNDIAKRIHITKSGEALRLMFWQKSCGTIELANVANKAELVIY